MEIKDCGCPHASRGEEKNSRFVLAEYQGSGRCHLKEAQDVTTGGWGRRRMGFRGKNANASSSNASDAERGRRNKMHFRSFGGASCVAATRHEGCHAMTNPSHCPPPPTPDPELKASHYISKGPHLIPPDDERLASQRRRLSHR